MSSKDNAAIGQLLALQGELVVLARQHDERAKLIEKRRSRVAGKAMKRHYKTNQ